MKDYTIQVSFTGRCSIYVQAENEDEARDKALENTYLDLNFNDKEVSGDMYEWDWIIKEARGNVKESYISDIEIYED